MVDEQTRRSVETMCQCGLGLDGLKSCFPKISEEELQEIYINTYRNKNDGESPSISCNCS